MEGKKRNKQNRCKGPTEHQLAQEINNFLLSRFILARYIIQGNVSVILKNSRAFN